MVVYNVATTNLLWNFVTFLNNFYFPRMHHLLTCCIFINHYLSDEPPADVLALYKTEICTVFYIFYYLKNEYYNILFIVTFFKFCIFDYFTNVVLNQKIADQNNLIFLVSIHGIFLLNLYWFILLIKAAFKMLLPALPSHDEQITEMVVSYTMFANILVGGYAYSLLNNQSILHMCSIIILSISSYCYHNACYKSLKKYQVIDYTTFNLVYLYFVDIGAIHFCSFLSAFHQNPSLFYGSFLHFWLGLHVLFFLSSIYFKTNKSPVNNILVIIPSAIDVVIGIYASKAGSILRIQALYASLLPAFIIIMEPCYGFSHILFHIALLGHTYIGIMISE